jgi:hypothetical protein
MSTSTRIVDLPDSTGQSGQITYTPINVHPNPYSNNNIVLPQVPMPQPTQGRVNDEMTPEQQAVFQNIPIQQIPSRDIHMNSIDYMQDEKTKPNFIPNCDLKDYITSEYTNELEENKKHKSLKYRKHLIDNIINEIQTPILLALIFMVFQMPFFNNFIQTKLSFLYLFKMDGTINNYGMIFKSILFGIVYYIFILLQNYIETI